MSPNTSDHLSEKVRKVLERLSIEERHLLNAVMKVEAEHLHKAQPQLTQELFDAVERHTR